MRDSYAIWHRKMTPANLLVADPKNRQDIIDSFGSMPMEAVWLGSHTTQISAYC